MMFFTDENHYCRGIWEIAKTNTCKALRYCDKSILSKETVKFKGISGGVKPERAGMLHHTPEISALVCISKEMIRILTCCQYPLPCSYDKI